MGGLVLRLQGDKERINLTRPDLKASSVGRSQRYSDRG